MKEVGLSVAPTAAPPPPPAAGAWRQCRSRKCAAVPVAGVRAVRKLERCTLGMCIDI